MILLCDEDIGRTIPTALALVRPNVQCCLDRGWKGKDDTEWLTLAGGEGLLVFSCNKAMLKVPRERETIIREKVGIVFLTGGQERLPDVLRLLLVKWQWLETIDQDTPRPFAYYLYPTGRTKLVLSSQTNFL